jgi:hypothetical protein
VRGALLGVLLVGCAGSTPELCTPEGYTLAVGLAYAPHVPECREFVAVCVGPLDAYETEADLEAEELRCTRKCPGYQQAQSKVAELHREHVACR